jgi:hypothetical protein
MAFTMQTSLHGRRFGLSSTGGLVSGAGSTGNQSTAIDAAAQMWGPSMVESHTSAGDTLKNSGISIISSGSTNGASFVMSAPVTGVYKEVHFQTSATALTFNTTAVSIFFNSTLAEGSSAGSTTLSFAQATAGLGGCLAMRGLSDTVWSIVSNNAGASS